MHNSVQRSERNLHLHIKADVNEPNAEIGVINLTITSSALLFFSPHLHQGCTPLRTHGSPLESVVHVQPEHNYFQCWFLLLPVDSCKVQRKPREKRIHLSLAESLELFLGVLWVN